MIHYLIIGVMFLACYQNDIHAMKAETPDAAPAKAGDSKEAKKPEGHIYRRWANLDGCPNAVKRTAIIKGIFDRNEQRLEDSKCESFFYKKDEREKSQKYWDNAVKTDFPAVCLDDNGNFIGYGLLEIEGDTVHVNAIMVDEQYAGRGFELELLTDICKKYRDKTIDLRTSRDYAAALTQKLLKLVAKDQAKQQEA